MAANISADDATLVDGFKTTFYLLTPEETYHQHIHQLPNYNFRAIPVLILLSLIDISILYLRGLKDKFTVLDTLTNFASSSYLIAFEVLIYRGTEIACYIWVYDNYRLSTLPWNSFSTYCFVFLGVDVFGYWWHRCSHEIALFWAAHEFHHSSDFLNISIAFRLSFIIRLIKWLFYMPLALIGVPPSTFLVHKQVNFIATGHYHSMQVPKLNKFIPIFGDIIEGLFMTNSNHRVHHAVNPYCIDKNYGQIFIVWDKLFGTYVEEREDEQMIYGITSPTISTNLVNIQVTSYATLWKKVQSMDNFSDKLRAVFYGPGWMPGTPRLGNPITDDLSKKPKLIQKHQPWVYLYIIVNGIGVILYFGILMKRLKDISEWQQFLVFCYITLAYSSLGGIGDKKKFAAPLEVVRIFTYYLLNYLHPAILGPNIYPIINYINLISLVLTPLLAYYLYVFVVNIVPNIEMKHLKGSAYTKQIKLKRLNKKQM